VLSPTVAPSEKLNETEFSPVPQVAVAHAPLKILNNQDPQENPTETVRKRRMGGYCNIHNLFFPPHGVHLIWLISQGPDIQEEHHEEDGVSQNDLEALISGVHPSESNQDQSLTVNPVLSGKWVCSQPSTTKGENHNKHITDKLEPLAKAYTHKGDKWRALGYSKAINALKSYHKPITSYEVSSDAYECPQRL